MTWQGQIDQPEMGWREVIYHRAKKAASQIAPRASISGCFHRLKIRFYMSSLRGNIRLALVYKPQPHTKIPIIMSNVIVKCWEYYYRTWLLNQQMMKGQLWSPPLTSPSTHGPVHRAISSALFQWLREKEDKGIRSLFFTSSSSPFHSLFSIATG